MRRKVFRSSLYAFIGCSLWFLLMFEGGLKYGVLGWEGGGALGSRDRRLGFGSRIGLDCRA